jgi:protein-S-isoprenylcysteine O-methyltransferase Ste14
MNSGVRRGTSVSNSPSSAGPYPGMATQSARTLDGYQHLRRAFLFVLLLIAVFALLFISSYPEESEFHEFVESVGISLIGIAIIGRLWCTLYIGGRKAAELVQDGPYSMSRNPLYFFSSIGAAGAGAETGSVTIAFFFGVATAVAFYFVARREEKLLHNIFGEAFAEYRARVPRFFPRMSGYRDSATVTVVPRRLYTTFVDSLVFFTAFPFFEFIEWLQLHHYLPIFLRLP